MGTNLGIVKVLVAYFAMQSGVKFQIAYQSVMKAYGVQQKTKTMTITKVILKVRFLARARRLADSEFKAGFGYLVRGGFALFPPTGIC